MRSTGRLPDVFWQQEANHQDGERSEAVPSEMRCCYQKDDGKDSGGSRKTEWEHSALKMVEAHHKPG